MTLSRPPFVSRPLIGRRQAVGLSSLDFTSVRELFDGEQLPLLIEPRVSAIDINVWAQSQRDWLLRLLHHHGALDIRETLESTYPEESLQGAAEAASCTRRNDILSNVLIEQVR